MDRLPLRGHHPRRQAHLRTLQRLALQERRGDGETNSPNSDKFDKEVVKEMISKHSRSDEDVGDLA